MRTLQIAESQSAISSSISGKNFVDGQSDSTILCYDMAKFQSVSA